MDNNTYDFWFWLAALANFAQLESYRLNVEQTSNDQLMKYMEHQDQDYLITSIAQNEKIIQQNEEIIQLLKGGEDDAQKNVGRDEKEKL